MGIDIPPPKGGPAMFSNQTDTDFPQNFEDEHGIPELTEGGEHNDIVPLCLSDGGSFFCYHL